MTFKEGLVTDWGGTVRGRWLELSLRKNWKGQETELKPELDATELSSV